MSISRFLAVLFFATVMSGCQHRGVDLPASPVSGRILYRGRPLTFGRIAFIHPSGQAAGTEISNDGMFKLNVFQGNNRVSIECYDTDKPGSAKKRSRMMEDNKSLIPDRYMNYGTSGLTLDVQGEVDNVEFTLKD